MHSSYIKAELDIKGITQVSLARDLNVSQVSIGRIIHGQGRSRRIEKHISDILNIPLHELWPQWYGGPAA